MSQETEGQQGIFNNLTDTGVWAHDIISTRDFEHAPRHYNFQLLALWAESRWIIQRRKSFELFAMGYEAPPHRSSLDVPYLRRCRDGASCTRVSVLLQLLCCCLQMLQETFVCELHSSFRPAEYHVCGSGSATRVTLLSNQKVAAGLAAPSQIWLVEDGSQEEQTKPETEAAFLPPKRCSQSSHLFLAVLKWFNSVEWIK